MSGEMPGGVPPEDIKIPKAPTPKGSGGVFRGRFLQLFNKFLPGRNPLSLQSYPGILEASHQGNTGMESSQDAVQKELNNQPETDKDSIITEDAERSLPTTPVNPERPQVASPVDIIRAVREPVTLEFFAEIMGCSPVDARLILTADGIRSLTYEEQLLMLKNIKIAEEQKKQQEGSCQVPNSLYKRSKASF